MLQYNRDMVVLFHYSKSNNIATIQAIGSVFGSFLVTSLNHGLVMFHLKFSENIHTHS